MAVHDGMPSALCAKQFLKCQGHNVWPIEMCQDKNRLSKFSLMDPDRVNKKHMELRNFWVLDQVKQRTMMY